MLTIIFLSSIVILFSGYHFYGRFLEKIFNIDNKRKTPAHTCRDNNDYCPAPAPILFGHHFSSIAGAGPVVGPIIAGVAFGWLPALLWILIGSIFIGGTHDFAALVASLRHKGKSIAEVTKDYFSPAVYKMFLLFIWLTLVYVLIVFLDMTSATFKSDGPVASASILFIVIAVFLGLFVYRFKISIFKASLVFVPLVFFAIYLGQLWPIAFSPAKFWHIFLLCYAFAASVLPVWLLLQPRDYLSAFLLYSAVLAGTAGILFGNFSINYPAFISFYDQGQGAIFPFLFVVIACGAISGFHAIVASGTTAKQLNKEKDAKPIAYGAMLVEAIVAIIALSTIMIASKNGLAKQASPLLIFGNGIAGFLNLFGLPPKIGASFGILALSTFLLTTLDTTTRLARYIFQEFFGWDNTKNKFLATASTLLLPAVFTIIEIKDAAGNVIPAWKAVWPVFGATNQLMAALTLLVIARWLYKKNTTILFVLIPVFIMLAITLSALLFLTGKYGLSPVGITAFILLILSVIVIYEVKKNWKK